MIKIFKVLIFILVFIGEITFAQSVSKLLQSIQRYDFYHTRLYAHKMLKNKKKLSAGAYALAYVYYQNFPPFHNLDSADKYIHLSVLNYRHRAYVSKYGTIDSAGIYLLYDSIVSQQFNRIQNTVFPKVYDVFISHHPFLSKKLKEKIKTHQYQKITEYVVQINKSDTTLYYLSTYSNHPQLQQLVQILDQQIFNALTVHKTAAEYLLFLRNYPKNAYREVALQSLLDIYINEKNTAGLWRFAREFANDKYYSEQAWKWLFAFSVKKFNNEELEKFISDYPEFPFKKEILNEMAMNAQLLIPFADTSERVGFIDTSGYFKIPPIYDAVSPFKENIAVVIKNDSAFFINKNHQKLLDKYFIEAYTFYNGYAPVYDGKKWYFINRLGSKQSEDFDWISDRSADNTYVFKKNNLYGLCDYKGQIIWPAEFEKLGDFENHKSYYIENNLYGIIMDNGKKFPPLYQWISVFYNDYAIVKQNNFYGIINVHKELILKPEYDLIFHCLKDVFLVVKNKKYGFFNAREHCFIYSIQWDFNKNTMVQYFTNENYFKLILQNKIFVGDKNGMILNKTSYQDIVILKDMMGVKNKNKWGILNLSDKASPSFIYENIEICENQTIIGHTADDYSIIDKQGNVRYQSKNKLMFIAKNYYFEEEEEKGNIIDLNGKIIISDIADYKVFEKYIIAIRTDKTIKVIQ